MNTNSKNPFPNGALWIVTPRYSNDKWDWENFTRQLSSIHNIEFYFSCNEDGEEYLALDMIGVSEDNKHPSNEVRSNHYRQPEYFMDQIQKCASNNNIEVRVTTSNQRIFTVKNTSTMLDIEKRLREDFEVANEEC